MTLKTAVFLIALFMISPYLAYCCSCAPISFESKVRSVPIIIKAKVLSIADSVQYDLQSTPVKGPFLFGSEPILKVEKVLKGSVQKTILIHSDRSMCNFTFKKGSDYIVFIYVIGNKYYSSVCEPNFLPSDRKQLKALRKMLKTTSHT